MGDEKKKVCELEQRSQPKQVKKYVYTKQCRPVPRTGCDNADQMSLVPNCVPSSRKECNYQPQERCENVPKQHCYQIPYQVKRWNVLQAMVVQAQVIMEAPVMSIERDACQFI